MGLDYFTAVEKDGTLLRAGETVYRKKTDNMIEKLKQETQQYFKEKGEFIWHLKVIHLWQYRYG